ncbi:hypothetical protein ACFU98_23515 [Streptomyces sp. NPDC057575]|uniref:hypothetical protein n=1 Tax=unclassified Streptomyces TaxID=2593676 RepID=UPI0036AC8870
MRRQGRRPHFAGLKAEFPTRQGSARGAFSACDRYALRGHNQPLAVGTCAGLPDRVRELLPGAEDLSRIADGVLNTPQTAD